MPTIIKSDGSAEAFDSRKLEESLLRSGAGKHAAHGIAEEVARTVREGSRTHDVYRRAFTLLRNETKPVAARYALRRALLGFGPTGHPFEDFVSHLFRKEGWTVETRKLMKGKCVTHETDFYATRGGENLAAELKYHNDVGYRTDVKVALYVKSRFDDIWNCESQFQTCPVDRGFLITNTKFTSQAVQYASCSGVELIGWDYPARGNLYDRMCFARVYPVTALSSLKKNEKRLLIEAGVTACDMLRERKEALAAAGLPPERIGETLAEADALLALPHPYEQQQF
ncbi:MAG: restriction endonuclease [Patescibacteria group bacterium]|nr:restriction endonuclease [Patescibacteria group bacterium]MDE1965851.1 restriction endonuclease [Patescibacteria group bacterium]